MYKAEYQRKINKSSLILKPQLGCWDEKGQKDSIQMFYYNEIPYFISMQAYQKDLSVQFCYDITGRRALGQLLEYKELDYPLLQKIFCSFDQACIQVENFMLEEDDILLDPEFIFADGDILQISYCYLPGNKKEIGKQFKEFVEYLLQYVNHKDERAVQLAYGIHQRVAEGQSALHDALGEITREGEIGKDLLVEPQQQSIWEDCVSQVLDPKKESKGSMQEYQNNMRNKIQMQEEKQKADIKRPAAERLKKLLRKKVFTDYARQTEDTFFEADEEETSINNPTVCLADGTGSIQNQFVYQGGDRARDFQCVEGKKIIGSDLADSDIYIPLPMISRVHARIEVGVQGTFLEDMNSTNGTHVNGELLQYHERRMLQKGDIISLAGECYSFH